MSALIFSGTKFLKEVLDTHMRMCVGCLQCRTKPLNLSLESSLIEEIKIQAVREGRTVSEIATEVFREYLGRR